MTRFLVGLVVFCIALAAPCLHAEELPAAKVNPHTGGVEIADPVLVGNQHDIRYIVSPGARSQIAVVSSDPANDRGVQMVIAPDGDAYVVWWRETATSQVLLRKRDFATRTWSSESVLGHTSLPSRDPEIVHDGSAAWVALTSEDESELRIEVGAIEDSPDPFGAIEDSPDPFGAIEDSPDPFGAIEDLPDPFGSFETIGSTSHDGELDVDLQVQAGHLWTSWIDSDFDVAWAEYDYGSATWGPVAYESYGGDSVKDARDRIHTTVLGD